MIDLIGDIHGHSDKLEELLLKLGYSKKNGAYSHPTRKVLFVGDYIDRGPKIRETLAIVKAMVYQLIPKSPSRNIRIQFADVGFEFLIFPSSRLFTFGI